MQEIKSESELRAAIIYLENQHREEYKVLKQRFHLAYESIKPINIIKHTLKEAAESFDIKENLLITTAGISAGFITEKYLLGSSSSPFRKLLGTAVIFGITNLVATNPEAIKKMGRSILEVIGKIIGVQRYETADAPFEKPYTEP